MGEILKFYSTNGKAAKVTFSEALLKGLAPDGGLYLPESIPVLNREELESFSSKPYHTIAADMLDKYVGHEIDSKILYNLCSDAYYFKVPLEKIFDHHYIMRLDQGPTASFKDFAARMMSRLMQYFLAAENKFLTILTATSGDTGSAVANAFYGLSNIKVIILYPKDEVTPIQRKQMTTLQENITIVAVNGKFDDCQNMVKKAFLDKSFAEIPLSSANSINIGRLLPQSVYYAYAWSRVAGRVSDRVIFSVPSGNFGNLTAGLLAARMGIPVEKFIVATNENDEVPDFLRTGKYTPIIPSRNCISSAMNVGHPSNLARIIALFGGIMNEKGAILREPDMPNMCRELLGSSMTDDETRRAVSETYYKYNTILEPHGAVAWKSMNDYQGKEDDIKPGNHFIALETAHPSKFTEEMKSILGFDPPMADSLSELSGKKENYITIENNYGVLKEIILQNA